MRLVELPVAPRIPRFLLLALAALGFALRAADGPPDHRRDDRSPLTAADRLWCAERIERVYDRHRLWPAENTGRKPAFESVWSRAALAAREEDREREESVLRAEFGEAIDGRALQGELDRMAAGSRDPAMLGELFSALGDDPRLAAECLARPALVERRLRARRREAAVDRPDAGDAAADDFSAWWRERRETAPPLADDPERDRFAYALPAPELPAADCNQWAPARPAYPGIASDHTAVWTGSEMIVWGGVGAAFLNTGWRYNPATDLWTPVSATGAPVARASHTAIWTGTEMIVWGGMTSFSTYTNTGARYNPGSDSWTALSTTGAPIARSAHTAVWTGALMIVWGGTNGVRLSSGGRYDAAGNSWTATTATNAPSARTAHTAVWSGSVMIVWGGDGGGAPYLNTGSRYTPGTDSWSATSTTNAPASRAYHTASWFGDAMLVIGGLNFSALNTGGFYSPGADSWTPAPFFPVAARYKHSAVVTPSGVIVWGGTDGSNNFADGAYYTSSFGTFQPLATTGAPTGRVSHTAVWTGGEMIVWGGAGAGGAYDSGARYNPDTFAWKTLPGGAGPSARESATTVWTGTEWIVWGGYGGGYQYTGARYLPATDTWSAINQLNAPVGRLGHTAVWTGSKMVVWGGEYYTNPVTTYLNSGGLYSPATDGWTATATTGAPSPRYGHAAVWTGAQMVVWGGTNDSNFFADGARFDPVANSWTGMSAAGAPAARANSSAVWSGNQLLVWGGSDSSGSLVSGGRYAPAGDAWSPMSASGAPSARTFATAVWTGAEMIVWGGNGPTNTGARYNPASDAWTPTATTGAPAARYAHTAVWSGKEMLVWGGADATFLGDGGRYNPLTNSWSAISGAGAPAARYRHVATWTGSEMIVWGGTGAGGGLTSQGRYRPNTPEFTLQPVGATLCGGETVTLTAGALFAGAYRWSLNGTPLSDAGNVSGSATPSLTLTGFAAGNAGTYTVSATNACGSTVSAGATLASAAAPSGLANNAAADANLCAVSGNSVTWSDPAAWNDNGAARGWTVLRNGTPLASGGCGGGLPASTHACTDTTAAAGVSYTYSLRASNGCGLSSVTVGSSASDGADATPPAMSRANAAKNAGDLQLDWSVGAPLDAVLYGRYSGSTPNPVGFASSGTTAATGWSLPGELADPSSRFYSITARDACGNETAR